MKHLIKVLLCVIFPLGILYLLMLRGQKRAWPDGMKCIRYAHRGLHHQPDAPENSLAAFRAAIEKGFGAELDVHLMKDGNLAVIHDSSLQRTAGADVLIEDLTKEDLEAYRLEGTDEKIPLLEEVLALFSGRTPLIVELKPAAGNHNRLTESACAMLDRFPDVTFCIESFDPRVLLWLKKNRPEIIRGQLSGDLRAEKGHSKATMWALTHLLSNGLTAPDFVAYDHTVRSHCPELKLSRLLYGVQEVSWTVRDADTADALEKAGCLVIFEGF